MTAVPALLARVLALPSVPFVDRTRRLPERPGLYFVIKDDSEILYIGMSRKSIRQRWKTWHLAVIRAQHEGLDTLVRIAFVLYRDIDRLISDEKAAIREFRPIWNSMSVTGALERSQQAAAEACEWVDCEEHHHRRWPSMKPQIKVRPCVCIVHTHCRRPAPPAD